MKAVEDEKEDSSHPERRIHPEFLFMKQFEDRDGSASLAESRVMCIEASEVRESKCIGDQGFIRFASRNANALCELESGEISSILNDLQAGIDRENKTKTRARREACQRTSEKMTGVRSTGCCSLLSLLSFCLRCGSPAREEPGPTLTYHKRNARAVMDYIHSVHVLHMPKSATLYKSIYF